MGLYNTVFGANLISPANSTYINYSLNGNLQLVWPQETAPNSNLLATIMDVTSATNVPSLTLPNAMMGSNGRSVIVNNRSLSAISVYNYATALLATIQPGAIFFFYLTDNSSPGGAWQNFQYGAQIAATSVGGLAGAGLIPVGTTLAQSISVTAIGSNYTLGVADRANLINWTAGAGTLTLPVASAVGAAWYAQIRNSGSSTLTLAAMTPALINGASSITFNPGDSAFVVTDGTNYFTIGYGNAQTNLFQFLAINLPITTGNYTLSGAALNKVAYRFTSSQLTGNVNIIVPATVQQYWVDNETTDSTNTFTLSIGTSGQSAPPTVVKGGRTILYCDGTNVYNASTGGVAIPLAVNQGGTGAISASAGLANLGGTSTGIGVFQAANAAAARSVIAAPSAADAVALALVL